MQLDLLAETPAARRSDPVTSHEAAEAVTADGTRASQQREVVRLVQEYPGLTSAELSRRSGRLDRWQIARRLPEVAPVHVDKGAPRHCHQTGRRCVTWWPTGGDA